MSNSKPHYFAINFIRSQRKGAKAWQGRYRCRILTGQHKQIHSKMFAKEDEAKAYGVKYVYQLILGIDQGQSDRVNPMLTTADLIDQYLNRGPGRTISMSRVRQCLWWSEQIGQTRLNELEPKDIRAALARYMDEPCTSYNRTTGDCRPIAGRKRKPASHNRLLAQLKGVFKWATEEDNPITESNPSQKVKALPENNELIEHLTREQALKMLDIAATAEWDRAYLFFLGLLHTGCRKSEWLGMTWDRIDLGDGTAFIPAKLVKNRTNKTLPLSPAMITELRRIRAESPAIGNALLFPSATHPSKPYNHARTWDRIRREMDLGSFRLHSLRHTAASLHLADGRTLSQVAELLGHKSLGSTNRYSHMSAEQKKAVTAETMAGLELSR